MRRSKFSEEQVVMALRQAEAGTPVASICRKLQITEATFYRWKKEYGDLGVPELRELKQFAGRERTPEAAGGGSESGQDDPAGGAPKKMVSPAQRRAGVAWAAEAYRLPQRRACRALGVARSTVRYRSVRPAQGALEKAPAGVLAAVRVSYGYRGLHALLRREGWPINAKLVQRLYREEGLTLRTKRPKRRRSAVRREAPGMPTALNQRWAMDFVHDSLAGGGSIRLLTVLDVFTRECVALEAGVGFRGEDVARVLGRAGEERNALPGLISVDNGTEFTSRALDHWAYRNQVKLDFSRPGKPTDNAHIEAFNASLRRECLSQHWFLTLEDAQHTLNRWKDDYNNARPHSSLGHRPPAEARGGGYCVPGPERLPNSQL